MIQAHAHENQIHPVPARNRILQPRSATGKQTSLRTKDETEARSLLNARNEAQRQPVLNLHLARAYLTASDPAFVERTWQTVMAQLQARGKESNRERYATVFKSPALDGLRHKKLLETTADDFFAVFKCGNASTICFLKRLHHLGLERGLDCRPDCRAESLAQIQTQRPARHQAGGTPKLFGWRTKRRMEIVFGTALGNRRGAERRHELQGRGH
jgi:hypothetical protein